MLLRALRKTSGLALIELVIVVVIIGVLTALSFPKYFKLVNKAHNSATLVVAGSLSVANSNNYSGRKIKPTFGFPIADCTDVEKTLQKGLPKGYSIVSQPIVKNKTIICDLLGPGETSATFTATGIN